jgi:hypothetical protein
LSNCPAKYSAESARVIENILEKKIAALPRIWWIKNNITGEAIQI